MILGFTIPHKNYIGTIEYSDEDQCYYGKLINTKDLVNYEADDVRKLIENFQRSVDFYLEWGR